MREFTINDYIDLRDYLESLLSSFAVETMTDREYYYNKTLLSRVYKKLSQGGF